MPSVPRGEVSGDELESSRQGSRLEGLQAANGSDLRGQTRSLRRGSGPSYLLQEAMKHKTAGDTLEDTVKDCKVVQQVWDTFKKSFEQSTSFWHFRDTYLADFRQDESETMADLDSPHQADCQGVPMEEGV